MTSDRANWTAAANKINRRRFLKAGLAAMAAGAPYRDSLAVSAPLTSELTITRIDRVGVKVPFREIPARNMARELPHWTCSEIFTVHLQGGARGHGETLAYYTWGRTTDEEIDRARGKNAAAIMWDDSLGAGIANGALRRGRPRL